MKKTNNILKDLGCLFVLLKRGHLIGLTSLTVLMVLASIAEVISIGSILPFLAILTSPDNFVEMMPRSIKFLFLGVEKNQLMFYITLAFCSATIFASVIRVGLIYLSNYVAFKIGAEISNAIFKNTIYKDYLSIISQNSSVIINLATNKVNIVIYHVIIASLNIVASTFILSIILATLLIIEPLLSVLVYGGFGLQYYLFIWMADARLNLNSQKISNYSNRVIQIIEEALGGIRDVILGGHQESYCKTLQKVDGELRNAQRDNQIIGAAPRYIIESFGLTFIGIVAFTIASSPSHSTLTIPILGMLALGAQKILPLLHQLFSSITGLIGHADILKDVIKILQEPAKILINRTDENIEFISDLTIDIKNFKYTKHGPVILKDIKINIKKGMNVGIIGSTGSGKSTLIDIISGLIYVPGSICIDGKKLDSEQIKDWQTKIAYVSQFIYLSDATIEENIAFGVSSENINHEMIISAASRACIGEEINKMPEKYKTAVGQGGTLLSGGQRQRIGLARAFYSDLQILILDEATSALDELTESVIVNGINKSNKKLTTFIVSHNMATLKNCDLIIEISNGEILWSGNYDEIQNRGQNIA